LGKNYNGIISNSNTYTCVETEFVLSVDDLLFFFRSNTETFAACLKDNVFRTVFHPTFFLQKKVFVKYNGSDPSTCFDSDIPTSYYDVRCGIECSSEDKIAIRL